jgi:nitroreductase
MEKLAETQTPIHEVIGRRWSPRAFSERLVEADKLVSIFEAARWAASSRNEQPWAFMVAATEDPKNHEALVGVLLEFNAVWARKAPVLVLTIAHTVWQKEGTPNHLGFYDLGQAAACLTLQATAIGLMAHQMGGFNVELARERFAVPAGWEPVSVIAIGYPGEPESLPEHLRDRETAKRARKPLTDFVFSGTWGHSSPIVDPLE